MSITDDQIAEIEALANDAAPFDWGPDIGMTHAETVYACAVGPDSILALITRLREAERDAARYRWLAGNCVGHWLGEEGPVLVHATPWNASWRAEIDAAIDADMREGEQ